MNMPPSLQQGIDQAGSPIKLLWKPAFPAWKPPVIPDEFVGWREEQAASYDGVGFSDLSHHMRDLFIEGPDATRLLSEVSANNYESFAIDHAKQFVPVTEDGLIVQDGILLRESENRYVLSGPPASQNWVLWNAEQGGYDVEFVDDVDSQFRPGGGPPVLFRYQVQGPQALALVEQVFGGPLPETKFFHSTLVTLDGREFRALRHGMAGQPGYEFIGDWKHAEYVKDALLRAGEDHGLIQIGALAYSTNGIESGWIPTPTPAIYTDPKLQAYREWLPIFSFEGQRGIHGTDYSENIEDFYVSPYELGYGRSISFDHDFIGRDALQQRKDDVRRTKATLELDADDARATVGDVFWNSYARYRIEVDGEPTGMTFYTARIARHGTVLALSLVDTAHAEPGTAVTLVFGEHPGPAANGDAEAGFTRLRATVQPSPYDAFARTEYRKD